MDFKDFRFKCALLSDGNQVGEYKYLRWIHHEGNVDEYPLKKTIEQLFPDVNQKPFDVIISDAEGDSIIIPNSNYETYHMLDFIRASLPEKPKLIKIFIKLIDDSKAVETDDWSLMLEANYCVPQSNDDGLHVKKIFGEKLENADQEPLPESTKSATDSVLLFEQLEPENNQSFPEPGSSSLIENSSTTAKKEDFYWS